MSRNGLLTAISLAAIAGWLLWVRHANEDLAAGTDVIRLRSASLEITSLSPPRRDVARVGALELPLHWDVQYEGMSGSATIRIPVPVDADADFTPKGVLIERIGAAFEIAFNGHVLLKGGTLDRRDRFYAKAPVHLLLPARLFEAEHNELVVRLRTDTGYRAGLSPPLFGSPETIDALARRARAWRVDLPLAASTFSLVVGTFCLLLWWQQRDALYAWAGVGELLWAVTVGDTVIEQAPLAWPWWGLVLLLSRAFWSLSLYGIAEQVFGRGPALERIGIWTTQISAPLVSVSMLLTQGTRTLLLWYALSFSIWALIIVRLGTRLIRNADFERVIIWSALVLAFLASGRDVIAARLSVEAYSESAWAKYLAPLVGLVLMWIVSQRFRRARDAVLEMNATLADRIKDREAELRASFATLAEVERSRAVLNERQRILRDMHDGVGAHLASAVRQLETAQTSRADVAKSLRDSLMQLKLSIDAMNLPTGDVNALMANLRFRLESRIASAGIALRWDVDPLPMWQSSEERDEDAMRHLQFILLEAISNALQHARASSLVISARAGSPGDAGIEIVVEDDGIGPGVALNSSPRSMRERTTAIGAALEIAAANAEGRGTRVRIRLPIRDRDA